MTNTHEKGQPIMSDRRNILWIVVDQMRPDFIGPYGADFIATPHLNALSANGITFDNAITASTVCAPARASMVTGLPVSAHGAWTNKIPCKPGTVFLPERMNDCGYLTAAVGSYDHAPDNNPIGYQFLDLFSTAGNGTYMQMLRQRYPDAKSWADADETGRFRYPEEVFYDRWICDRTTDFLAHYAKTGTAPDGIGEPGAPFFLYCGFVAPHQPLTPPHGLENAVDSAKIPMVDNIKREDVSHVEKYRRANINTIEDLRDPDSAVAKWMQERQRYCELIAELDALVGRLVQSLRDNGLYENTTIIFTSDHGSEQMNHLVDTKGPWPYRSQLFIPLIIANQPGVQPGSRSDCLCGNLDIGATVLDIAGDKKAFGHSRSLLGMANGSVPERRVNMSEFCDSCKNLVDKRYTFSYYPFTGQTCLYDRLNDPAEHHDLSRDPAYQDIVRRFLMDTIDFLCLAKGVRIEAHDMTPETKAGIEEKDPKFLDTFDIAYPVFNWGDIERVEKAGLDPDYNEFCRDREIKAHYGVYFFQEKPKA